MNHGKNICKQLMEVRRRIAEENDIPLEIKECTYKGECLGTCPRCEAEVRYLEKTLAEKLSLGKVATVAGLALGLAASAQAQAPVDQTKDTTVRREKVEKMEHIPPQPLTSQPEEIAAIRKRNSLRQTMGCIAAEIQVILDGTPAYIGYPGKQNPLYEEKDMNQMMVGYRPLVKKKPGERPPVKKRK